MIEHWVPQAGRQGRGGMERGGERDEHSTQPSHECRGGRGWARRKTLRISFFTMDFHSSDDEFAAVPAGAYGGGWDTAGANATATVVKDGSLGILYDDTHTCTHMHTHAYVWI